MPTSLLSWIAIAFLSNPYIAFIAQNAQENNKDNRSNTRNFKKAKDANSVKCAKVYYRYINGSKEDKHAKWDYPISQFCRTNTSTLRQKDTFSWSNQKRFSIFSKRWIFKSSWLKKKLIMKEISTTWIYLSREFRPPWAFKIIWRTLYSILWVLSILNQSFYSKNRCLDKKLVLRCSSKIRVVSRAVSRMMTGTEGKARFEPHILRMEGSKDQRQIHNNLRRENSRPVLNKSS